MSKLPELMKAYAAYHKDGRNKFTHFFGVPLVVYSLFIPLGWFRFIHSDLPITGATVFFVCTMIYYFRVDVVVGLWLVPISGVLLYFADQASRLPFGESFLYFAGSFVLGWAIQLLGHYFEGRKPALVDNVMQVFNAPLFLVVELLFLLGRRRELRQTVEASLH